MAHTIREVMTTDPVCCSANESIAVAAKKMAAYDIGDVLVTGTNGDLRGVITDRDIVVRVIAKGDDPNMVSVGNVCSPNPVKVSSTDQVLHGVELMRSNALRRLPVVDNGKLIGIVSIGDLAVDEDPQSALGRISAAPPNQ